MKKTALVIFGVSGDLAMRKLLPALFRLHLEGQLPRSYKIFGVARSSVTHEAISLALESVARAVPYPVVRSMLVRQFLTRIECVAMDSADHTGYALLKEKLIDYGAAVQLCYLALPPLVALPVVRAIHDSGICKKNNPEHRLLLEKPFGFDYTSAQEFVASISDLFSEDQVYRIDHYMAKETSRNIAYMRFRNPLFAGVWSKDLIKEIVITASESLDIQGRGHFYEQTGAMRDIVQSHLLALAALVTMDEPRSSTPVDIHKARRAALKRIQLDSTREVVRGQYNGYRQDAANKNSLVETCVKLPLVINAGVLKGVRIVLQTGKALHEKRTEISVLCIRPSLGSNSFVFEIQPQESVHIMLNAKAPGLRSDSQKFKLSYFYPTPVTGLLDGYERVLHEAIVGDRTNFITSDELLETWRIVDPVVRGWWSDTRAPITYAKGSSINEIGVNYYADH